jgi:hypothetical protein
MFKFRQLAAGVAVSLGLAGAAQPLMAQSGADITKDDLIKMADAASKEKSNSPSSNYDSSSLARQLDSQFKLVQTRGTGDKRCFTVQAPSYTTRTTKQTLNWNVDFGVIHRGNKPLVRIYFNCQTMPMNVDIDRLKALLSWSGDHAGCAAYFKTLPNGKQDQLYIVADYTGDTAAKANWSEEVNALFVMADDTLHLWSGDLSKPIVQKETKNETPKEKTKLDINGLWDGKVTINDEGVGQYSMNFIDGVVVGSRARKGDTSMSMLTGTYILEGSKLTIEYKDVEKPEVYDVKMDGKTLTLTNKKGNSTLAIKLKKVQ